MWGSAGDKLPPRPHGHTPGRGRAEAVRAASSCAHASLGDDPFLRVSKRLNVIPSVRRQLREEKKKHVKSTDATLAFSRTPLVRSRECHVRRRVETLQKDVPVFEWRGARQGNRLRDLFLSAVSFGGRDVQLIHHMTVDSGVRQ